MVVADCEVNGKPIPGLPVPVFEMVPQAIAKVASKADVVKFVAAIEGVHSLTASDERLYDLLVFLKGIPGDLFKMLSD
ncbi:MAG: hypothetical protein A2Z18_00980 [Armatimonadetes bacterium RBG_16_58_9]|nr:MAG: hypothetical protein A2Z18_00980 [Armatimonadetes bacterium RBG_16_58_9]